MVNHGRALLLNVDGQEPGYTELPGEEYLPPAYRKLDLPTYLGVIRQYFFGPDPDRFMLNYRVRQLLALVHSCELVEFLTDLDSRITYDPSNDDLFTDSLYGVKGAEDYLFHLESLGPPDKSGRAYHKWEIEKLDDTRIRVDRQTKTRDSVTYDYTLTENLSSIIPLQGSGAAFRFRGSLPQGEPMMLTGYARPEWDLGQIAAALQSTGRTYMLQMFSVGTPEGATQPFKTFKNLWTGHDMLPYKLGAVILAMIYQMEALRVQHG